MGVHSSPLNRLFEKKNGCKRKKNRGDGRFIQRMYMRNIADIWTDIRIADIPELSEIARRQIKLPTESRG